MFENIPNWHPLFVYFPIGLFMGSIVLHGIRFLISKEETRGILRIAANWMLWLGAAAATLALLSGWFASNTVFHTDDGEEQEHYHTVDESTPAGAVDSFHNALTRGDKEAVYRLLAEDVLIFESGGAERSLEEYAGHHMPLDMEFSKNMKRKVTAQSIQESEDTAIIFIESRTEGTFKNKNYNLMGKETVILKRNEGQWKITHIHWSSMPVSK